ncbi:MAG: hypothetical protein ACHQRJ_24850 [Alphaproteobacteria bacterium]
MTAEKLPEMIERVRNTLLISLRPAISHDRLAEERCASAAREVIRALQAPTDEMLRAMNEAVFVRHEPPEGVYHAAISAALGERPSPGTARSLE